MIYKALFSDVDGTLVTYDYNAVPTDAVAQAIGKASEKITVCVVTGRGYPFAEPILKKLGMHTGFAILNNGGHVLDIATKTTLYEQPITMSDAAAIIDVFTEAGIIFYIKQDLFSLGYKMREFKKGDSLKKAYMFFTEEIYTEEQMDLVATKLSSLSSISFSKGHHNDVTKYGCNIVHSSATKLHGIEIVMKKLGLTKEECIGVGDSYNDFPLLMACGLKVAMGNAVADLKAIADFVVPSVENDGMVALLEKYILH